MDIPRRSNRSCRAGAGLRSYCILLDIRLEERRPIGGLLMLTSGKHYCMSVCTYIHKYILNIALLVALFLPAHATASHRSKMIQCRMKDHSITLQRHSTIFASARAVKSSASIHTEEEICNDVSAYHVFAEQQAMNVVRPSNKRGSMASS